MRRVVLVLAAAALLVTGCAPDRGACLSAHDEQTTTFVLIGKMVVPMYGTRSVCDVWEFPQGRPTGGAL